MFHTFVSKTLLSQFYAINSQPTNDETIRYYIREHLGCSSATTCIILSSMSWMLQCVCVCVPIMGFCFLQYHRKWQMQRLLSSFFVSALENSWFPVKSSPLENSYIKLFFRLFSISFPWDISYRAWSWVFHTSLTFFEWSFRFHSKCTLKQIFSISLFLSILCFLKITFFEGFLNQKRLKNWKTENGKRKLH